MEELIINELSNNFPEIDNSNPILDFIPTINSDDIFLNGKILYIYY